MYVCVYNGVILLYSADWHNIVNQLYFSFKKKKKWAIKPWTEMEETLMHITKWKMPIWTERSQANIWYDYNYMTFWKKQNYGDSVKISGCWRLVGSEGWIVGTQRISRAVNSFVWYYNGGYMPLQICPNPQKV